MMIILLHFIIIIVIIIIIVVVVVVVIVIIIIIIVALFTVAPSINSLNVSDNPALLGTEVTLVCDVDSTGKPMITTYSWYHNGSYIVDTNDPMLIINITDIVDYGSYSCVVSNVFGEDSDTILLEQGCKITIIS